MLSLVLLGCHASGKTTLARHLFQECTQTGTDTDIVEFSTSTKDTMVAEVCANTFNTLSLGQKLARKNVPAVVVTMPRNKDYTPQQARRWIHTAREYCPNAKIALVVTKNDLNPASPHLSSRSALNEHLFDGVVYDVMQAADGVDRLFYTSNTTGQGMTGLKAWVGDMLLTHRDGEDFTSFGGHGKNRFRTKHRACSVDECNNCTLQ